MAFRVCLCLYTDRRWRVLAQLGVHGHSVEKMKDLPPQAGNRVHDKFLDGLKCWDFGSTLASDDSHTI